MFEAVSESAPFGATGPRTKRGPNTPTENPMANKSAALHAGPPYPMAEWEAAGATWWLEGVWSFVGDRDDGLHRMRSRIAAGPPSPA